MDADTATVTTDEAARRAGVSARTIRRWVQRGLLPATETPEGYLIALADLPSAVAAAGQRSRPRGHAVTDAATDTATVTDTGVSVNANARDQLMAVRDEWLAPLVAQITAQAERIGRLEAERDEARRHAEAAEAERDRLVAAQAAQDDARAQEVPMPDNPSGETSGGFWVRVRRVFGGTR